MKQNKMNKIIIGILIVLTLVLGYRVITEHKRVSYYVCYDRLVSPNYNTEHDVAREICLNQVYERND